MQHSTWVPSKRSKVTLCNLLYPNIKKGINFKGRTLFNKKDRAKYCWERWLERDRFIHNNIRSSVSKKFLILKKKKIHQRFSNQVDSNIFLFFFFLKKRHLVGCCFICILSHYLGRQESNPPKFIYIGYGSLCNRLSDVWLSKECLLLFLFFLVSGLNIILCFIHDRTSM